MDTTLDPLRNSELHRALAFARARETHPGLPGDLLLELCDAAWQRAAGDTRDGGALERFERALDVVARSYRVGGGRLSISEVAEDAIPLAALQPYIDAQKRRPAPVEPEPVAVPARRTLTDKLSRLPRIAPAPIGVSLAAGIFGVTAAAQAGVLEQTPLAPLSFTDRSGAPEVADRSAATRADRAAGDSGRSGDGAAGNGSRAGSPWVGEVAASAAAADSEEPAGTEQFPRAAGTSQGVEAPAAPVDLASSTGGAPAPVVAAPAEPVAAAPEAPAAPSPSRPPVVELPAMEVEMGDEDGGGNEDSEQQPSSGDEQPQVGVHFPTIQLPGGVTVQIPQPGLEQGEEQQGEEQEGEEQEGEEAPPEELPEQPLPPEEQPDGVSERPATTVPAPEAAPQAPAAATPPAVTPPAATPPTPAPAPPAAPAQPEAPAPTAPPA